MLGRRECGKDRRKERAIDIFCRQRAGLTDLEVVDLFQCVVAVLQRRRDLPP